MLMDFDAVVVGGGPAGSISARALARLGQRVLLVDRRQPGESKVCGWCLSPNAHRLLQTEGLGEVAARVAVGMTRSLVLHAPRGSASRLAYSRAGDPWPGLVTPRGTFDSLLVEHACRAGVEVRQPASARVVEIRPREAILKIASASETSIVKTRLLVGADGAGSAIARAAGLAGHSCAGRRFGFSFDICNEAGSHDRAPRGLSPDIHMHLTPCGYLGAVTAGAERLHVAGLVRPQRECRLPAGADAIELSALPFPVRAFLADAAGAHPGLDCLWRTRSMSGMMTCAPMPWRPEAISAGPVALVGDAAGYVEPFTGEGMAWAIHSALLLRDALADAAGECARALTDYSALWAAHVGQAQRRCGLIARVLEHPMIMRALTVSARHAPGLASAFARRVVAA